MMMLLMPMTSPFMLTSGPPELPRLMAASVWMKSSIVGRLPPTPSWRPLALTMPGRDGVLHAQRIADGQDPFADLDLARVAELGEGRVLGLDLDQGDVGLGVGADDLGRRIRLPGR